MTGDPDPLEQAGRRLGAGIAFAFGALMHLALGVVLLIPQAPALSALTWVTWLGGAVLLWRWRRDGLIALLAPFLTAGVLWLAMAALLAGSA